MVSVLFYAYSRRGYMGGAGVLFGGARRTENIRNGFLSRTPTITNVTERGGLY